MPRGDNTKLCFLIVVMAAIILWYVEYTRESLEIITLTPASAVVRDYMKAIGQWDNIKVGSDGRKKINYMGGSCGLPNGPFGYRYRIQMKGMTGPSNWCIPPHRATYKGYNKCDASKPGCYQKVPSKLPIYPNAYYSPNLDPTPAGSTGPTGLTGVTGSTSSSQTGPSPFDKFIQGLPSGQEIPGFNIYSPDTPWSSIGPVGADFDDICAGTYNSDYGMLQIPENQYEKAGYVRAICSRGHVGGLDKTNPGRRSTFCLPMPGEGLDPQPAVKRMNEVCAQLYPETELVGIDSTFCPQPGMTKAICGYRV